MNTPKSWLTLEELEKSLRPYEVRRVAVLADGIELWETGWGAGFVVTSEEAFDRAGLYDGDFILKRVEYLKRATMPPGWRPRGRRGERREK